MQETFRKSRLTLPLPAPLAAGVGQVTYTAIHRAIITDAQLCLSDTGTGAGTTAVTVKVNGVAIGSLSIAGAAANASVSAQTPGAQSQYPAGAAILPGDVVTVDIGSVPATTVPKAGFVVLELTQQDV